jgi:hypothetical protein
MKIFVNRSQEFLEKNSWVPIAHGYQKKLTAAYLVTFDWLILKF